MTDFVKRIDDVLKSKNLKRAALCSDLELSPTSVTDWGRRGTIPSGDICVKIADYLGVSVEWLITGNKKEMTEEERKLLKIWECLSDEQKDTLWTLLNKWDADITAAQKKDMMA